MSGGISNHSSNSPTISQSAGSFLTPMHGSLFSTSSSSSSHSESDSKTPTGAVVRVPSKTRTASSKPAIPANRSLSTAATTSLSTLDSDREAVPGGSRIPLDIVSTPSLFPPPRDLLSGEEKSPETASAGTAGSKLNSRGQNFFKKKQYLEARKCFLDALADCKSESTVASIWYNLGRTLEELGLSQQAQDCWRHVLELDPNREKAAKKLSEYTKMKHPLQPKKFYFYITQDGVALLFKRDAPVLHGLYTDHLQSCVAIGASGSKGIALIHDTGKLDPIEVDNLISRLGKKISFRVFYNPAPECEEGLKRNYLGGTLPLLKKKYDFHDIFKVKNGNVLFKRDGSYSEDSPPPEALKRAIHWEVRHYINILNNVFLKHAAIKVIKPDLQFDGTFPKPPSLSNPNEKFIKEYKENHNDPFKPYVSKMLNLHKLFVEELNFKSGSAQLHKRVEKFERCISGAINLPVWVDWLLELDRKKEK